VAVQRHCVRTQLLTQGIAPDFDLVEKLRLKPEENVTVDQSNSPARSISRDPAGFVHRETLEPINFNRGTCKLSLADSVTRTNFSGIRLACLAQSRTGISLPKHRPGIEYFDAERVGSKVILRHWGAGDRFQPIGMPAPVKLQDLFVNQKVPRPLRHKLVLAETEKGEIFWVEGLRISERFQLTKSTKRRLQWQWRRD